MTNDPHEIHFTSSKNVDPFHLESLYFQYMYMEKDGRVINEMVEVEDRGVVHMGRRAEWFNQQLEKKDAYLEQAVDGDKCIGFSLYFFGGGDSEDETTRELVDQFNLIQGGYLYLVCVDEDWVRRRIGRSLVYRTMAMFQSCDVQLAVSEIAVTPRKNVRSSHLFTKAGWKSIGELSNYQVSDELVQYEKFYWQNEHLPSKLWTEAEDAAS